MSVKTGGLSSSHVPRPRFERPRERDQQVRGTRLRTQQFKWEHCVRVTRRVTLARYAFTATALLDQQPASEERVTDVISRGLPF